MCGILGSTSEKVCEEQCYRKKEVDSRVCVWGKGAGGMHVDADIYAKKKNEPVSTGATPAFTSAHKHTRLCSPVSHHPPAPLANIHRTHSLHYSADCVKIHIEIVFFLRSSTAVFLRFIWGVQQERTCLSVIPEIMILGLEI